MSSFQHHAPGHRAILASAGSGKTFQLANRYIGLMALGVEPDSILAVTFSRKAAGEIFDKVLQRLAVAASGGHEAARLASEVREAGFVGLRLDRSGVLGILRRLVTALHLARISTLDSFYISILRAFPFEFGLGSDLSIIDQYSQSSYRLEALRRVLREAGRGSDGHKALLEEFKQATFGQEDKALGPILQGFIESHQDVYLEAPDESIWGGTEAIWESNPVWESQDTIDLKKEGAALLAALPAEELSATQWKRFESFVEALPRFDAAAKLPGPVKFMFMRFFAVLPDLDSGHAVIKVQKNLEIAGVAARSAARITRGIATALFRLKQQRTKGTYRLLRRYEETYNKLVRKTGKLTFSDIQLLLAGKLDSGGSGKPLSLDDGEGRLYVDYRLDASLDHWLLDEFQDTSTVQWLAMHNLVDEVVQDREGRRTLFYVGDVKQAIHGWRGGDSNLFERLLANYNQHETRIETTLLSRSWRSSQIIMDATNLVFGQVSKGELLASAVADRWNRHWARHEAVKQELEGVVDLYVLDKAPELGPDKQVRYDFVCQLLKVLKPEPRGLTCAVLVKTNDNGREMVEQLRAAGINAARDGAFQMVDNPVCRALVSLLQYAVHPGDTMARQHVAMTPLSEAMAEAKAAGESLGYQVLREVGELGFEAFVRNWTGWLERRGALDPFARMRLGQLASAAMGFDSSGRRNPALFIDMLLQYQGVDSGSQSGVQVMTMHKSKGLEFDLVVLPDLDAASLKGRWSSGFAVAQAPTLQREPIWVLDMPAKELAEKDPVLAEYAEKQAEADSYEALCLLYVSMTRAKQGLYMVTTEQKAGSSAVNMGTLVRQNLAGAVEPQPLDLPGFDGQRLCRLGDPGFLGGVLAGHEVPPTEEEAPGAVAPARRARLEGSTPSGEESGTVRVSDLFSLKGRAAASLGTAVHELFAGVEFADDCAPDTVAEETVMAAATSPEVAQSAREMFLRAMEMESVQNELSAPESATEVWREQSFEAVVDQRWVTGVFDRVVLYKDDGGQVVQARILDFKTDRVATPERLQQALASYAPQLEMYRRALCKLTGLEPRLVETALLFVRTGDVLTTAGSQGE